MSRNTGDESLSVNKESASDSDIPDARILKVSLGDNRRRRQYGIRIVRSAVVVQFNRNQVEIGSHSSNSRSKSII